MDHPLVESLNKHLLSVFSILGAGYGDAKTKVQSLPGGAPTELQLASDQQCPVFCQRQHSAGAGAGRGPEESGGGE